MRIRGNQFVDEAETAADDDDHNGDGQLLGRWRSYWNWSDFDVIDATFILDTYENEMND